MRQYSSSRRWSSKEGEAEPLAHVLPRAVRLEAAVRQVREVVPVPPQPKHVLWGKGAK